MIWRETGKFNFDMVAPGRYLLAVNPKNCPGHDAPQYGRSYFPGVLNEKEATFITVEENKKVKVNDYKLPPVLNERTFSGIVISAQGSPVKNATVFLVSADGNRCFDSGGNRETKTDENGNFEIKGFEGYEYRLRAYIENRLRNPQRLYSEIVTIPVSQSIPGMKLILNTTN